VPASLDGGNRRLWLVLPRGEGTDLDDDDDDEEEEARDEEAMTSFVSHIRQPTRPSKDRPWRARAARMSCTSFSYVQAGHTKSEVLLISDVNPGRPPVSDAMQPP
jgi:hypothetical protein